MTNYAFQKTVTVPKKVLDSMMVAYQKWGEFADEFEDFVLSSDQDFLKRMQKARKLHKEGKTFPLKRLKAKFGL